MSLQSPSRIALNHAFASNQLSGNENLGAISEQFGFLPFQRPLTAFPESHKAWDFLSSQLPDLYSSLTLRKALDGMPVLLADSANLADNYLQRAALVLSLMAHSYWWVENEPPTCLPASILEPWTTVSTRLGRPEPFLPYSDIFLYNWQVDNGRATDSLTLEDLKLLVPVVGNAPERIFLLTQVEIHSQCASIVGAVIRAQEAVLNDDLAALRPELLTLLDRLQHITTHSLLKIDTDPYSPTYVDPVLWSKTVARYAIPIKEGIQGPSGTSSPLFQLLDVFFGRTQYDSPLGRESLKFRGWLAPFHRQFLEAVEQVSVRDYVDQHSDPCLKGIFQTVLDAYVGDNGFLGAHRRKVYGFLETAYKVGRSGTDLIKERSWESCTFDLDQSRKERLEGAPAHCHFGRILSSKPTDERADDRVKRVVVDTTAAGIRYSPGDRAGILPVNSDALVQRTLKALNATGAESVRLDSVWRQAWPKMTGETAESLNLSEFLKYAKIRPVERTIAKALYSLTANSGLQAVLNARTEELWELWDLLEALSESGFDTRRLWKAEPWEAESICKIAPPPMFRVYSISSAVSGTTDNTANDLELTIGELDYESRFAPAPRTDIRYGDPSNSVSGEAAAQEVFGMFVEDARLTLKVIHPSRFHLPLDPKTPIVMFAAGAGIAPFRGFLSERARQENVGSNWLFFGTRTSKDFLYQSDIERWIRDNSLSFDISFSDEPLKAVWHADSGGSLELEPGSSGYVAHLIESEENASRLYNLIRSPKDGGGGACFYISGSAGFAVSIMNALKTVIFRYSTCQSEEEREDEGRKTICRMIAENRLMQDIFATYSSFDEDARTYNVSDIVLHNNSQEGYWCAIDGKVYDLSSFLFMHPGGDTLLRQNAGTDATRAYETVLHHLNSDVEAVLGMYEIGSMRRLRFDNQWGIAVGSKGLRYVSVESAFRSWVRFLYLLVELENALVIDYSAMAGEINEDELLKKPSLPEIQGLLETHNRFAKNCLNGAFNTELRELWATTIGLCAPDESVLRLERELEEAFGSGHAERVSQAVIDLARIADTPQDVDTDARRALLALAISLPSHDLTYLYVLKMTVRDCVQIFETYESATTTQGKEELLEAIQKIPRVIQDYYAALSAAI